MPRPGDYLLTQLTFEHLPLPGDHLLTQLTFEHLPLPGDYLLTQGPLAIVSQDEQVPAL